PKSWKRFRLPRNLPVRRSLWLDGSWGNVVESLLRLLIHGVVHSDDLVRVGSRNLFQDFGGESATGAIDSVWGLVTKLVSCPWTNTRGIHIALCTPRCYQDRLDTEG